MFSALFIFCKLQSSAVFVAYWGDKQNKSEVLRMKLKYYKKSSSILKNNSHNKHAFIKMEKKGIYNYKALEGL